ncbi:hypothetical protein LCI18_007197 [Fusarium solani-melongenae]|uniref:Uncharacterized protein n=1 Tax=Fusarium solani subsp. cucurbitae TaxID=2747967 RepID=A0ACD3Z579_FUSSC|nr:hypothetical protein LCI18_007197 [Fusarium solani-melongenae]
MLVLIVGVTGDLGQRLANAAIARGAQVRGLGRHPSKLPATLLQKLASFVQSENYYDIPAIEKGLTGVDAVICAYSTDPTLYLDGVNIFVAPTWNSNWTNISYGDFPIYNSLIAFADHAAMTSTVRPVYFINGAFAEYTLVQDQGPLRKNGESLEYHYWGNVHEQKTPWTTMDDAAAWTIEVLLTDEGVRAGKGGYFKFYSGTNSAVELAKTYESVSGTEVKFVCDGTAEDLEKTLEKAKEEEGRVGSFESLLLTYSKIALQGLWQIHDPIVLDHAKKPTTFEEHLKKRLGKE